MSVLVAPKLRRKKDEKPEIPNYLKFTFGGAAGCCAQTCVQPLDLIKNRMQMSGIGGTAKEYANTAHAFASIVRNEGVLGLYNGLSAALLRQMFYGTTRLGLFQTLVDKYKSSFGQVPNFAAKATIGMFAGMCGAFVATPTEVCLVRMTLDGRLPPNERRNYKSVFDAMRRIVAEEGPATMLRGALPTVGRAAVVNGAQLGTYSQAKEQLLASGYFSDNVPLHFCASMISGMATAISSLPIDVIKTRVQNARSKANAGALASVADIVTNEGVTALWKGLTPYYIRLGPITVLVFVFLEQFNAAYLAWARSRLATTSERCSIDRR